MDFHGMKRKELQALCKKHGVPANLTNLEMADRLFLIFKENEKPVTRGRSCLKNLAETVGLNDSNAVPLEPKKVRFSPENETFEFEYSETDRENIPATMRAARAARRRSMIRHGEKKLGHVSANSGYSEPCEETKDTRSRNTRSRRQNIVGGDAVIITSPPVEEKRARKGTKFKSAASKNVDGSAKLPPIVEMDGNVHLRNVSVKESGEPMRRRLRSREVVVENVKELGDQNAMVPRKKQVQRKSKRRNAKDSNEVPYTDEIPEDMITRGEGEHFEPGNVLRRSKRKANEGGECELLSGESGKREIVRRMTRLGAQLEGQEVSSVEGETETGDVIDFQVPKDSEAVLKLSKLLGRNALRRKSVVSQTKLSVENEARKQWKGASLGGVSETVASMKEKEKVSRPSGPLRRSRRNTTIFQSTAFPEGELVVYEAGERNQQLKHSRRASPEKETSETYTSSQLLEENGKVSLLDGPLRRSRCNTSAFKSTAPAIDGDLVTHITVGRNAHLEHLRESILEKEASVTEAHLRRSKRNASKCDSVSTYAGMDDNPNAIGKNESRKRRLQPILEENTSVTAKEPQIEAPPRQTTHKASNLNIVGPSGVTGEVFGKKKMRRRSKFSNLEGEALLADSALDIEETPRVDAELSKPEAAGSNSPVLSHKEGTPKETTKKRKRSRKKSSAKKHQRGSLEVCPVIPELEGIKDLTTEILEDRPSPSAGSVEEDFSMRDETENLVQDNVNEGDKINEECQSQTTGRDFDYENSVEPQADQHSSKVNNEITSPVIGLSFVHQLEYIEKPANHVYLRREFETEEKLSSGKHLNPRSDIMVDDTAGDNKTSGAKEHNVGLKMNAYTEPVHALEENVTESSESGSSKRNLRSFIQESSDSGLFDPPNREGNTPYMSGKMDIDDLEAAELPETVRVPQMVTAQIVAEKVTETQLFSSGQWSKEGTPLKPIMAPEYQSSSLMDVKVIDSRVHTSSVDNNSVKEEFPALGRSNPNYAEGEKTYSHAIGVANETTFGASGTVDKIEQSCKHTHLIVGCKDEQEEGLLKILFGIPVDNTDPEEKNEDSTHVIVMAGTAFSAGKTSNNNSEVGRFSPWKCQEDVGAGESDPEGISGMGNAYSKNASGKDKEANVVEPLVGEVMSGGISVMGNTGNAFGEVRGTNIVKCSVGEGTTATLSEERVIDDAGNSAKADEILDINTESHVTPDNKAKGVEEELAGISQYSGRSGFDFLAQHTLKHKASGNETKEIAFGSQTPHAQKQEGNQLDVVSVNVPSQQSGTDCDQVKSFMQEGIAMSSSPWFLEKIYVQEEDSEKKYNVDATVGGIRTSSSPWSLERLYVQEEADSERKCNADANEDVPFSQDNVVTLDGFDHKSIRRDACLKHNDPIVKKESADVLPEVETGSVRNDCQVVVEQLNCIVDASLAETICKDSEVSGGPMVGYSHVGHVGLVAGEKNSEIWLEAELGDNQEVTVQANSSFGASLVEAICKPTEVLENTETAISKSSTSEGIEGSDTLEEENGGILPPIGQMELAKEVAEQGAEEFDMLEEENGAISPAIGQMELGNEVSGQGFEFVRNVGAQAALVKAVHENSEVSEEILDEVASGKTTLLTMQVDFDCNDTKDILTDVNSGISLQLNELKFSDLDLHDAKDKSIFISSNELISADRRAMVERDYSGIMEGQFNFEANYSDIESRVFGASPKVTLNDFDNQKEEEEAAEMHDSYQYAPMDLLSNNSRIAAKTHKTIVKLIMTEAENGEACTATGLDQAVPYHGGEFPNSAASNRTQASHEADENMDAKSDKGVELMSDEVKFGELDHKEEVVSEIDKSSLIVPDISIDSEGVNAKRSVRIMKDDSYFEINFDSMKEDVSDSPKVTVRDGDDLLEEKFTDVKSNDHEVPLDHKSGDFGGTVEQVVEDGVVCEFGSNHENGDTMSVHTAQTLPHRVDDSNTSSKPERDSISAIFSLLNVSSCHGEECESHECCAEGSGNTEGKKFIEVVPSEEIRDPEEAKFGSPAPVDLDEHQGDTLISIDKHSEINTTEEGSAGKTDKVHDSSHKLHDEIVSQKLPEFEYLVEASPLQAGMGDSGSFISPGRGSVNYAALEHGNLVRNAASYDFSHWGINLLFGEGSGDEAQKSTPRISETNSIFEGSKDAQDVKENAIYAAQIAKEELGKQSHDRVKEEVAEPNGSQLTVSTELISDDSHASSDHKMLANIKEINCENDVNKLHRTQNSCVFAHNYTDHVASDEYGMEVASDEYKAEVASAECLKRLENSTDSLHQKSTLPSIGTASHELTDWEIDLFSGNDVSVEEKKVSVGNGRHGQTSEAIADKDTVSKPTSSRIIDQSPAFTDSAEDKGFTTEDDCIQKRSSETDAEGINHLSAQQLNSSMATKKNIKTNLVQRTPNKFFKTFAMKENTPSIKAEQVVNFTAAKPGIKRRALEDLQKTRERNTAAR